MFNQTTTTSTPFTTPSKNTMSAFNVGSTQQNVTFGATSTPAPGLAFGMKKPEFGSPITSSFGGPAMTNTQTGHTSGNIPPTALTFGIPTTAAQTSLSIGSAPASSQNGLSFASAPATSQTGPSFGSAPATSQTGLPFGFTTAASQTGPSFGSISATSQTGLSLAFAPATPQAGPSFGSAPATPQTGPFGSLPLPSQNGITAPQTNIAFGTSANTAVIPQRKVTFDIPMSTVASAPQAGSLPSTQIAPTQTAFGMPAAATTIVPQTGTSFGASFSTVGLSLAPTLQVAATTTTSGLTFGATGGISQPSVQFGTGLESSTTAATSAPSMFSSVGFGGAAPVSTRQAAGTSTTTVPRATFLLQTPKSASEGSATIRSSATTTGLGGLDHSAVATAQYSADTITSVRELTLPNEIQQTVLAFKEHVNREKRISSEVARSSTEQLTKLTQQITATNNLILNLGSVLSQQKCTAERIKVETIKSLNDCELVQKIKDSPVVSEERSLSIRKYLVEKISAFEESAKTLQTKIEYVHHHVSTLPQEASLSAEDLKRIVKKLHDSFVVIGAHAYKLHNDTKLLKVQYMTLRSRYVQDESATISFSRNREFELRPLQRGAMSSASSLEGPNPFSASGYGSFNALLLASRNRGFAASTSNSSVGGLLNTLQQPSGRQSDLEKSPGRKRRGNK